jgi:hypothetical protein
VIDRFDYIRQACKAHFMLIHHCGKNAEAGARGWSGLRAAIDTEIRVTATKEKRYAEITKDRDLGVKGRRIGFKLDIVGMGTTKWGKPATSCVVSPDEAPAKGLDVGTTHATKSSKVGTAVIQTLAENPGITKAVVAARLADRHPSSSVYRSIKDLVDGGAVTQESDGRIFLTGNTKGGIA